MTSENLNRYIQIASFFESPIVRFVIDGPDFEPGTEEINRIIKGAIPAFEEKKIILAIENHDRFKAAEFAEMVAKAESEYIGICLDAGVPSGVTRQVLHGCRQLVS